MSLYVRELTVEEERRLRQWLDTPDPDLSHRVRVVLLSSEGYRIPEIGEILGAHPTNLRKWIHRFNKEGLNGLMSSRSGGPPPRFDEQQKARIVELALTRPGEIGLGFDRWTLHRLASECARRGIVESISHEYVRQVLLASGIDLTRARRSEPAGREN